jgi:hypothetical protein
MDSPSGYVRTQVVSWMYILSANFAYVANRLPMQGVWALERGSPIRDTSERTQFL